ncbi:glutaminyl-peptide cyclotransferase [Labilibaculum euxinus]|uniref:Glutaminyl-peptide cyclotransferase n=1 Tax=Labilibaculum euxinus TaxID=2686357 RepID=A0A7M4D435_9BACT|nr:glutaminyl-peptide cyclotransferase [Labilibaculum euxinus]MUP37414.1 glutaminyl-peptide cyclotransferase [Labilibaculum euxinus]MVB06619.1 glutaminyl-peptide cyclotransferase [Labilibaculum euxinus]
MNTHSFLSLVCFLLLVSCNGKSVNNNKFADKSFDEQTEKTTVIVNSLRLKQPHRGDLYTMGGDVEIEMTPRNRAAGIDSVQFWADETLIGSLTDEPWTMTWVPEDQKMGKHDLKVMAYHEDGTIGIVSTFINLKTNIPPVEYSYEIINEFPHDRGAYTQGLFYHEGFLYEGTGQRGESTLRKVKLENGEALSVKNLEQEYFGEGITFSKGKIIQLTWNAKKVFVVDPVTFEKEDTFEPNTSNNQGWGITSANNELILSDGTNVLTVLDADNYSRKRIIEVYDNSGMVTNLNELEYINGKIYANVWLTDRIVIINPETGRVEGNLNLGKILKLADKRILIEGDEVLNGIAWDSINNRLFVTGKRWPKLFEIKMDKK